MKKVNRAIISVTDKTGVVEFAKGLAAAGVEIISTGGTAEMLKNAGLTVVPISTYTGFPEMLDGRLKTLHPTIHGGILGMRDNPKHMQDMESHGIPPIDMVVVNLYAFEQTVAKGCTLEEAIENIDIGGPTMLRAAAKNYNDVAVVVDPADYGEIIGEMNKKKGMLSRKSRFALAKKVFQTTARYDAAISNYLGSAPDIPELEERKAFPETFTEQFEKVQDLRYGENPHQKAAFYRRRTDGQAGLADAKQLHGKELSYNNILDLNAAVTIAAEFHEPAAVIIKHNNPCGTAVSKSGILDAYDNAYACDRTSAFGSIVGFNRPVTRDVANVLSKIFLEAVIAPGYEEGALAVFAAKKNLRVIDFGDITPEKLRFGQDDFDRKRVCGGMLL
ncbi:MAG: bifunctional phosphoribosylaminoimidazolecarboxamide formyltransferase/IMP cyclohydrolase, partial [Thermodesulfobacteriota bacterium]